MRLETERLVIRDLEETDLDAVHAWRSDPEVARYMGFEPASRNESHAFLVSCLSGNREAKRVVYNCAIVRKQDGQAIGWIGWGPPSEDKATAGDCYFGYALRRDAWNHGYGTEVLRAVIAFVQNDLGVEAFFGETDVRNDHSAHVMEKAGMEPMGVAPWDDTSLWFRVRRL